VLLDSRGATFLWVSMFALGTVSALLLARVKTAGVTPG